MCFMLINTNAECILKNCLPSKTTRYLIITKKQPMVINKKPITNQNKFMFFELFLLVTLSCI